MPFSSRKSAIVVSVGKSERPTDEKKEGYESEKKIASQLACDVHKTFPYSVPIPSGK